MRDQKKGRDQVNLWAVSLNKWTSNLRVSILWLGSRSIVSSPCAVTSRGEGSCKRRSDCRRGMMSLTNRPSFWLSRSKDDGGRRANASMTSLYFTSVKGADCEKEMESTSLSSEDSVASSNLFSVAWWRELEYGDVFWKVELSRVIASFSISNNRVPCNFTVDTLYWPQGAKDETL